MVSVDIIVLSLILEGKQPVFLPLAVDFFIDAFYQVQKNLSDIIMKGCWILSNIFSETIEMIMWFLFSILLTWYIT